MYAKIIISHKNYIIIIIYKIKHFYFLASFMGFISIYFQMPPITTKEHLPFICQLLSVNIKIVNKLPVKILNSAYLH